MLQSHGRVNQPLGRTNVRSIIFFLFYRWRDDSPEAIRNPASPRAPPPSALGSNCQVNCSYLCNPTGVRVRICICMSQKTYECCASVSGYLAEMNGYIDLRINERVK